jgi:hypothetical protein
MIIQSEECKERCVMIRIGFDPAWDAELHNREIRNAVEQSRMAQLAIRGDQSKTHPASLLLAWIGRGMAALGTRLDARFGGDRNEYPDLAFDPEHGRCSS